MQSQEPSSPAPKGVAHPKDTDKPGSPTAASAASHHEEEEQMEEESVTTTEKETLSNCIGLGIVANMTRFVPPPDKDGAAAAAAEEGRPMKTDEESDAAQLACKKAIAEALDRSATGSVIENLLARQHHRLQYIIQVGVPAQLHRSDIPIEVDEKALEAFVLALVRQPIEVKVTSTLGGLWNTIFQDETIQRGSLAVVASVSMIENTDRPLKPMPAATAETRQVTASTCEGETSRLTGMSPSAQAKAAEGKRAMGSESSQQQVSSSKPRAVQQLEASSYAQTHFLPASVPQALAAYAVSPRPQVAAAPAPIIRDFRRSSSMDVLAHVSSEIRDQQKQLQQNETLPHQAAQVNAMLSLAAVAPAPQPQLHGPPPQPVMMAVEEAAQKTAKEASGDYAVNNTNYKKLPEGKTPKNNTRLFVRHPYTDFSQESPSSPEEHVVCGSEKTANAAFPLKLHEILSEIERDGYDDIIGWLPHGRAFKIHKQQEFVDVVLTKYFNISKKSSFNRQLNLYNFRRLSGVGPDQGAYYHELFLRGMSFLTRRIQRCKVNGNRIRAAGNPDEEPVLANYPACPPSAPSQLGQQRRVSQKSAASAVAAAPPRQDLAAQAAVLQYMAAHQGSPASVSIPANAPVDAVASLLGLVPPSASAVAVQNHRSLLASTANSASLAAPGSPPTNPTQKNPESMTTVEGEKAARSPVVALEGANGANQSSAVVSFPLKLQRILDKLESDGNNAVISWLSHGRAFMVHNSERFVNEVMPIYFNQSKYSSFQRQLHMYNFQRITTGRDKGAYHHPHFQRGQPSLCQKMQRTRVNGKGTRQPGNPQSEPDFYALEPVPHIKKGSIVEIPSHVVLFSNDKNAASSEGAEAPVILAQQKEQRGASVSSSSEATESEDED